MSAKPAKHGRGKQSAKSKGQIVEEIAAWLHDWPGVTVAANVYLPALSDPSRRREIDVLLTTTVTGYLVRFAIECKNEAGPIGTPMIDAFIGKLGDVGIPPQQGIFISASGYTKTAIRRAEKAGVRPLMLRGLSIDGLKASILRAAQQSIVYFTLVAEEVTFFTDSNTHMLMFVGPNGRMCGTVPHLIAAAWTDGRIPCKLGKHEISLDVPLDWRIPDVQGRPFELLDHKLHLKLRVDALAMTVSGRAEEYSLAHPSSQRPDKLGVRVFFDAPERRYPLAVIHEQAELDRFLNSSDGYRITQRIKVPRILYNNAYWPLSRRAYERISGLLETPTPTDAKGAPFSMADVDGLDIASAWEQPMSVAELDELLLSRAAASKNA